MGDVYMSATEVIKGILKDKNVTQVELAERTNVTKQNLSNKMNRDNFSTLELVEIADALEMQLLLKNTSCQTADYLGRFPQIISDGNTCHSLRSMRQKHIISGVTADYRGLISVQLWLD